MTARAFLFALVLALPFTLSAQEFDAVEFFGADHFTPVQQDSARGNLHAALTEGELEWLEPSGSGDTSVNGRFSVESDGLRIRPDSEHKSCELQVDAGVHSLDAKVQVIELEAGGSVAWHIRGIDDDNDYLAELKSRKDGTFLLSIRVRTRARYVAVAEATADLPALELPAEFSLRYTSETLIAGIGDESVRAAAELKTGLTAGLAVSDEPALLRDLSMDVHLHPEWIADAAARMAAREALARLREMATVGLLGGVRAHDYPDAATALKSYSEEQRRTRVKARNADAYSAADRLSELADNLPGVAMAQHEAGVGCLLAGRPAAGREYLRAAVKLNPAAVTYLALGEAYRRTGELAAAEDALKKAAPGLGEQLAPDLALIEGRLLADRGRIKEAAEKLNAAAEKWPAHMSLASFAASADALTDPRNLREIKLDTPLGLTLISDMERSELKPLMGRLEPYMVEMRKWLPAIEEPVEGVIAIFAGPVDYLRAALLVAGDNLDHVAGMYLPHGIRDQRSVMACAGFGEDELVRTLVHEIWHLALSSTGREAKIPRWLNEGMAVYLSAGRREGSALHFDTLPTEFNGMSEKGLELDQDLLTRAADARPHTFYVPGEVRGNYYAAWALVWYYATRDILNSELLTMLEGDDDALADAVRTEDLAAEIRDMLEEKLRQD